MGNGQNLINKIGKDLQAKIKGTILLDEFSRGRYSTDASIYQIIPIGVILPKDNYDVVNLIEYSQKHDLPLLARGGGSSQCGQTVGECIIVDYSKYQNQIIKLNVEEKTVWVQPGVVLDQLNDYLKKYNLWYPIDVSTSSRATIGGMTGNNSCGARSLYYGNMVHNVLAIEAILDDGSIHTFDKINENYLAKASSKNRYYQIIEKLLILYKEHQKEIDLSFPKLLRRVGGYNLSLIHI